MRVVRVVRVVPLGDEQTGRDGTTRRDGHAGRGEEESNEDL